MGDPHRGAVKSGVKRDVPSQSTESGGAGFWIAVAVGVGIMAFGIGGLLRAAPATRPGQVALSLVGLDLLHDAVVAPIVCLVGLLLARWLPRWARAPVRAGLFASAATLVVGWAALRGYGRDAVPDNPTVDPLDYRTAVLTVFAVVWTLAAAWAVSSRIRSRRFVGGSAAPETSSGAHGHSVETARLSETDQGKGVSR
jgi:hypothetical protein